MESSEWLTRAGCLKSSSLQTLLQNHFSWNCHFISKNVIYIVSPTSTVIRDINWQSITCISCLIYLDLKSSCFTILRSVCLMNFCLMHFFAKKTSISFSLSLSLFLIINVVLLIRDRRTFWEGFIFVYTVLQLKIFFSLWLHFRNTNDAKLHHDHVYLFWNTSLVVPIFSGKTNRFG